MTTVLICDDNESIRSLIREVVTNLDLLALETGDGLEALQLAEEHRPDAIILDVLLHGCSGLEVLERLKSDPLLAAIPVLLITGSSPVLNDSYLSEYGAHNVMAKPFKLADLATSIQALLD